MLHLEYLFEIQYISKDQILHRTYIAVQSENDLQKYAEKHNFKIIHQRIIASNLGDPLAKGNELSLFINLL